MIRSKLAAWLPVATLFFISPQIFAADFYSIDPDHTSVIFCAGHAGLSFTYGFFRKVSGQYQIDETNPANCQFQLRILAESLDTNNADRDTHLRGPDFFDVKQFPEITFDSTRCEKVATTDRSIIYKVTGDLTIHGVKRPIQLNLRMLAKKPGATGTDMRTGFLCSTELKRSEYKMSFLTEEGKVGDAIAITVSFEGAQQAQPAAPPTR
jgi:polyisoprenoid-binding protein YceI